MSFPRRRESSLHLAISRKRTFFAEFHIESQRGIKAVAQPDRIKNTPPRRPMSAYSQYIVSYDITSRKERSRVSKTLVGYGFRVQKSVFECLLSPAGKARLIASLDELDLKTGYIYIYQINKRTKRVALGKVPPSADDGFAFVV